MRQILIEFPSKVLFFLALALAGASFVRDLYRRARTRNSKQPAELSSLPLYFLAAAWALVGLRGPGFVPEAAAFAQPWKPLPIYAYGVMLGTSLIIGWFLALRLAKQDGIAQEEAAGIYMWTAVSAIIGARVLYVIANFSSFESATEIFMLHRGGMVAYGGFIGGTLGSLYQCWRRKIPLLKWADVSAPSVILGTGITRIGCFLYGCDYGQRSDAPWALSFPRQSPAWKDHLSHGWITEQADWSQPIHPTQLYEMVFAFILFGAAMWVRKKRTFSGQVFVVWVMGYGLVRPLIEALRDDDQRGYVGPLTTSQFIGVTAFTLGAILLVSLVRRHRADPGALRYWEPAPVVVPAGGKASRKRGQERSPK